MKDLIIEGLDRAAAEFEAVVVQNKQVEKYLCIEKTKPQDIMAFMYENNIPEEATFGLVYNEYEDHAQDIALCWYAEEPVSAHEIELFKASSEGALKFKHIAFRHVSDVLTANGYVRTTFRDGWSKYYGYGMYSMYLNKEFDKLVEYYSMFFTPKETL